MSNHRTYLSPDKDVSVTYHWVPNAVVVFTWTLKDKNGNSKNQPEPIINYALNKERADIFLTHVHESYIKSGWERIDRNY